MGDEKALVVFGDGLQAYYYDEKPKRRDREGVWVYPMLIVPSLEIRSAYSLSEEHLTVQLKDGRKGFWIEYPESKVDWLHHSPLGSVILVWCGLDGRETKPTQKVESLFDLIEIKDKEIANLRASLIALNEIMQDSFSQPIELLRKQKEMSDVFRDERDDNVEERGD